MPLNKPKRIEDYILRYLQSGPILMLELVKKTQKDRPKTTKQAVYAALRILKKNEQIITYKGVASLNLSWLNSMVNYFALAKRSYIKGDSVQGSFIDLENKEKIKYYFNSPAKADIFWTHALYLLLERSEAKEPVFIYNPHEWFLLARYDNENEIFKTITKKGHRLLLTVGGNTFLDRYIKKNFDNGQSQYHTLEKQIFKEKNYYINIIGDFLIEVWLDQNTSNKVDNVYTNTKKWDNDTLTQLKDIAATEGKMKIIISRNQQKAKKIKRSLKKYFVI